MEDCFDFEIELETKDLFYFSMRHFYFSFSGILGLIISFGALALAIIGLGHTKTMTIVALFGVAALFTIVQPLLFLQKAARQRKLSKDISGKIKYHIDDKDILISQGSNEVLIHWYEVRKYVVTGSSIYLYMSPVRAFIFPKDQCGDSYERFLNFVPEMIKKYKDYDGEEEKEEEEAE